MELKLYRLFAVRETLPPIFWSAVGIGLVGLLGLVDYLTGNKINISLFYLAPIVLVTWAVNPTAGMFMSFLSTLTWLAAEFSGVIGAKPSIYFWNALIHAGFFFTVASLVAELQKVHKREQRAARTDFLTGAMNRRYFYELVQMQIDRSHRYQYPFTVAYIDLDNFKPMNDRFRHEMGDEVLRCMAGQLKSMLRRTDIVARLEGDEFAVLLPFADQCGAEAAVRRVHARLKEIVEQKKWPVTMSMGSVTCVAPPSSLEHLISMADQLMYEVKQSTKNAAHFVTWEGNHSIKAP